MNGEEAHDTYYVYDGNGNLCFVLPLMAADALAVVGTYTVSNDALQKYAYLYRYDGYNRCIYKKLPGADPVYTVYDAADRPVFTQDGQQRERGEWTFNISDSFNRVVLTGTCHNVLDYTQNPLDTLVVKATWANTTNALKGYTVTGVTLTTPTVQQANYYDSYEFLGLNGIPNNSTTAYAAAEGYGERFNGGCRGQQTGVWQANLNGGQALYSVNYYDDRYRMVQQKGINGNGEQTATYTHFSFTGQPLKIKRVQGANTEVLDYTYDHADRLLTTVYRLNNDPAVTLADNVYDEIGRLITDRRNGNANLKTDYAYNLRSWVKSITSPLFTQTLYYQENIAGNTPCYNGNISRMQWRTSKDAQERGYRFTYDNLSRMKNAVYGEGSTLAANVERFNEQVTAYDKMGNILGLLRYGQISATSYGLIDNLNLTYNGNQLQAVSDNATNSVYGNGMEFKDGATATTEYEYDKNGNLTKDLNKNISRIEYNCLNLPSRVTFANGDSIRYEYAADGTKLRTVHTIGGTTTTTDYCGNAVYENGELKMLLNDAGYVSFPDKKYHFYIKDHQGNVRVVADADGNVEEVNDYYPFGGLMSNATGNDFQKYKYNGKELDRKAGLNLYDYGARFYDPAIGRWHVVDPMLEKYYPYSPYGYCLGNPLKHVDIDGKYVESAWDVFSLALGAKSFWDNIKSGNIGAAVVDGFGVLADGVALALPVIPGGVGAAIKGVRTVDKAVDAIDVAKGVDKAADVVQKTSIGKYRDVADPKNMGAGKGFTPRQKRSILEENMKNNGGELRSDISGKKLDLPVQSKKGVKANMNQAEVDHIYPKSRGGTNSSSNAQVISKEENLKKLNKLLE